MTDETVYLDGQTDKTIYEGRQTDGTTVYTVGSKTIAMDTLDYTGHKSTTIGSNDMI